MVRFFLAILAALGVAGSARAEVAVNLRQAFVETAERGPAVVFLSDEFRAAPSDDLLVVTYTRPTPAWHFNSPKEVVDRVHRHLGEISGFGVSDMVAISSEKPLIRVFVKAVPDLDLTEFALPQMTIAKASAEEIAALKSIGSADFALYLVEAAAERTRLVRQLFGERAPGNPQVNLTAAISTANAKAADDLRRSFRKASPAPDFGASFAVESTALTVAASLPFDKDRVLQFFSSVCDAAQRHGASCVDWRLKTETQQLQLRPQG